MIRKWTSIVMLFFALAVMLGHSFIGHHHHGDEINVTHHHGVNDSETDDNHHSNKLAFWHFLAHMPHFEDEVCSMVIPDTGKPCYELLALTTDIQIWQTDIGVHYIPYPDIQNPALKPDYRIPSRFRAPPKFQL